MTAGRAGRLDSGDSRMAGHHVEETGSRFVGLAQIGADLGESPETVRKWVQNGTLGPVMKLPNGKWKMLREDYDAWLANLVVDRRIA